MQLLLRLLLSFNLLLPTPLLQRAMFFGQNATTSGGGSAPVATTKTCSNDNAGATTLTCTWSTDPAIGEAIVCGVNGFTSGLTYSITDSNSNTYTAQGSQFMSTVSSMSIYMQNFYFLNLPTSIHTTTFNLTGGVGTFIFVLCDSATGVLTSGAADGQSTGSISSGTNLTLGSITTTAKDWVFCSTTSSGGSGISAGAGFTAGAVQASNEFAEYLVQGASGLISPTATLSTSDQGAGVCSAFK